jgi:hypothetical protein
MLLPVKYRVDPGLYQLYDNNDLRKSIFFKWNGTTGSYHFYGSYDGTINLFNGLATDEVYLVRAEAYARTGDKDKALDYLNTLLMNRWKTSMFTPLTAATDDEALALILEERRKELAFRGLRWPDLRRLNKDARFAVTLSRTMNEKSYTLTPADSKYTFQIPLEVIAKAGIAQNP